ncbi:hypothetical protein PQR75_45460 [Paraburkholderia fungorum]|uniref:hypothetical protein n=1 Tax=Paraburkholderia fungorum TaxID=134537 RepID=UPI0038B88EC3
MDQSNSTDALDANEHQTARSKPRVFKYVADGTKVATGCIKTKDGDLTEHNVAVTRHRELAMSTRR